jgi:hypothetical protein
MALDIRPMVQITHSSSLQVLVLLFGFGGANGAVALGNPVRSQGLALQIGLTMWKFPWSIQGHCENVEAGTF